MFIHYTELLDDMRSIILISLLCKSLDIMPQDIFKSVSRLTAANGFFVLLSLVDLL
jgi:hypothetical protein